MSEEDIDCLLLWLGTFSTPSRPCTRTEDLADGSVLLEAFSEIDRTVDLGSIKRNVGSSWPLAAKNFRTLASHMERFYNDELREAADFGFVDADRIARGQDPDGINEMTRLMLGCVIKCSDNQVFIGRILEMDDQQQQGLQEIVSEVMDRFPKVDETPRSPVSADDGMEQVERRPDAAAQDEFGVGTELMQGQLDIIERLTTENARLDQEKQVHQAKIEQLESVNEKLAQEAASRRSNADDGEWKIKQLEFERDEKQGKVEELERLLERKEEAARKTRDDMDILRAKAKKVDRAERARVDYEKQMEDMRTKMASYARLKVSFEQIEQERDTLILEKEALQTKVNGVEKRMKSEIEKFARQRDAMEHQLSQSGQLDGDSDELRQNYMHQSLELEQLRAQLDAAISSRESGEVYGESLGSAFGDPMHDEPLTAEVKAKLTRFESLREENESLSMQVEQRNRDVDDLRRQKADEIETITEELNDTKEKYNEVLETSAVTEENANKAKLDVKRMKGFLKEAKNVIEKQQMRIQDLTENENHSERSQTATLEAQLHGAKREHQDLELRSARELNSMSTAFYHQRALHHRQLSSLKNSAIPSWLGGYQRAFSRNSQADKEPWHPAPAIE